MHKTIKKTLVNCIRIIKKLLNCLVGSKSRTKKVLSSGGNNRNLGFNNNIALNHGGCMRWRCCQGENQWKNCVATEAIIASFMHSNSSLTVIKNYNLFNCYFTVSTNNSQITTQKNLGSIQISERNIDVSPFFIHITVHKT